jgi:hypothetical protein
MLPHNQALIAGLNEAIQMVQALDIKGVEIPGGFFVQGAHPWFAGPVDMKPPPGPLLPFGTRTKARH